jgi:hypothetical protein
MHAGFRHLRYGLKRLEPADRRHSRPAQRAAAMELEAALGPDWTLRSRSHSRGMVACAAGNPPLTRLGIDIELANPARPWREIAAIYLPDAEAAALDTAAFCRLWTFGEAHFKAFGAVPSAELLTRCARLPPPDDEPIALSARRWWWSEPVDTFWLSLVWEEAL